MSLDSGITTFIQAEDLEFGRGAKARMANPEPELPIAGSAMYDFEMVRTAQITPISVTRVHIESDDADRADIVDAVPLEIWEGEVVTVGAGQTMFVKLQSKMTNTEAHTVEIDVSWVDEQDKDLVIPGAVFYLSLGRTNKRGSIENTEKIRFRRRPDWTPVQAKRIRAAAIEMHKKFRPKPLADD